MRTYKIRVYFLGVVFFVIVGVIISRLFFIQVVLASHYSAQSRNQNRQRVVLPARRGTIYDRQGRILAASIEGEVKIGIDWLADSLISKPLKFKTGKKRNERVPLKRVYPFGGLAASTLGFVGKDGYGLAGIEYAYDRYLRGEDGWVIMQRDGRNNRYERPGFPKNQPQDGCNVFLTIDAGIQKVVQHVLRQALVEFGAKQAFCIVMDPVSGKILAMANEPSFNPNFPFYYSPSQRLNICISYNFEPGSTFKVLTAACALQEKKKSEIDLLNGNNGVYEIYNQTIRDLKPYGYLTFAKALSYSSNVCFAKVADEIGNKLLYDYIKNFGFGSSTGIDIPGEEAGIVHSIQKWSGRTHVTMAIGQEISVTLLQMMMLFASVANGGILVKPLIVEKITDEQGRLLMQSQHTPIRRVISVDVARRLCAMLEDVVANGTGTKAAIPGIAVAGKTGTAQIYDSTLQKYSPHRVWASFIGFVPASKPQLLCGVVIEEPAAGHTGGSAAAPCFSRIMSQIISHPNLEFAETILKAEGRSDQGGDTSCNGSRNISFLKVFNFKKASDAMAETKVRLKADLGLNQNIKAEMVNASIYTPSVELVKNTVDSNSTTVPNCIGKDLREAVEVILKSNLTPYSVGSGIVKMQSPKIGTKINKAEICTLICSFDG